MATFDVIPLILAAGKGERMESAMPKVAHPVCGKALVARVVEVAQAITDECPFVIVGAGADMVREVLDGYRVHWVYQKEQLGTGHAVLQAKSELDVGGKNVVIMSGDAPLLREATLDRLLRHHQESEAVATLATTDLEHPAGYGRVLRSQHGGAFVGIVEERDANEHQRQVREINAGLYIIDAHLLFETLERVGTENAQGEYYLTDVFNLLSGEGHNVEACLIHDSEELLGVNDRVQLARVEKICRSRNVERLQRLGATIVDPATTYVDDAVEVGPDCVIEAGVHLLGSTVLGRECRIGCGSHFTDCQLADGVVVRPYTIGEEAVLDNEVIVGPFARLRPGTHCHEKSRVGNFVELKKTELGAGSKANHLAYLGDANIGEGVNVGAGTITCNYDGFSKHVTTIGDDVFVGSNSTLVAPLTLAPRSFVAAGSTVNRKVPEGALALGRARQVNKEGYRELLDRRMRKAK